MVARHYGACAVLLGTWKRRRELRFCKLNLRTVLGDGGCAERVPVT